MADPSDLGHHAPRVSAPLPRSKRPRRPRLVIALAIAAVTALACGTRAPATLAQDAATPSDDPRFALDAGRLGADATPASGADVTPSDPCAASDADGDGFGTHPSCARRDCDDSNRNIHPDGFEACNGLDDDCSGQVDDGLGESRCGVGACARVVPYCADGRRAACTAAPPAAETCNGVDDDCNGRTDDGLEGEACGVGACVRRARCENGAFAACVPGPGAPETCNGVDDDCNGRVDEGFGVEVVNGTYTALRARHPSCDGSGERMGPNCNAAMHRACAGPCRGSGFGPLENSGDVAIYACVRATTVQLSFAALAQAHASCDGATERVGPNCNAAIHRTCAGRGHVSGFGPVEQGASDATIACVAADVAEVVETTYTTLATHHDGCTQTARIGPACNAAINRFCATRGARTGYGPVENSGDRAFVVCVRD
jgi:hypothetical protein